MTTPSAQTLAWMREGTSRFLGLLDGAGDAAMGEPSLLPAWTRAHVAAHVARNAEALGRLLTWARTGVETPPYASPEQRDADIDRGARQPPAALRADVRATAAALSEAVDELPATAWAAQVAMRRRPLPAARIPWLRAREVWLHAVDLDAGAAMADLPDDLVDALLDDVAAGFDGRAEVPALELRAADRGRRWRIHADGPPLAVSGTAADLAAWLVGRSAGMGLAAEAALPALPAWL